MTGTAPVVPIITYNGDITMLPEATTRLFKRLQTHEPDIDPWLANPPFNMPADLSSTFTWDEKRIERHVVETAEMLGSEWVTILNILMYTYAAYDAARWVKSSGTVIDAELLSFLRTTVYQLTKNLLESGKYVFAAGRGNNIEPVAAISPRFYDGNGSMPGYILQTH
jgi:hypothetical protein